MCPIATPAVLDDGMQEGLDILQQALPRTASQLLPVKSKTYHLKTLYMQTAITLAQCNVTVTIAHIPLALSESDLTCIQDLDSYLSAWFCPKMAAANSLANSSPLKLLWLCAQFWDKPQLSKFHG